MKGGRGEERGERRDEGRKEGGREEGNNEEEKKGGWREERRVNRVEWSEERKDKRRSKGEIGGYKR